jgi:hypothetical protein
VVSWTKRRKINIFEKKFIFIPINDYLHWSLCVVVNPGKIENAYGDDEVRSGETDAPFLLFLDSLRAHQKNKVKGHIYSWLNLEATRLNLYQNLRTRKNESLPFWTHSMPMFDPVGKFHYIHLFVFVSVRLIFSVQPFSSLSRQWMGLWRIRLPLRSWCFIFT